MKRGEGRLGEEREGWKKNLILVGREMSGENEEILYGYPLIALRL
jgi:hypothetical protein